MATADTVYDELSGPGTPAGVNLYENRSTGLEYTTKIRRAVFACAFEMTLYLKRRGVAALKAKRGNADTMLGYSVDAASWGGINHELLVAVAKKVGMTDADIATALAPVVNDA
jgi:hypothetical protein